MARYFLLRHGPNVPRFTQLWQLEGTVAIRAGFQDPFADGKTHVHLQSDESLDEALRRIGEVWFRSDPELVEAELAPGEHFGRIARPTHNHTEDILGLLPDIERHRVALADACGQLIALIRALVHIFDTVHPVVQNFEAFGHETRNLLILACTELEAQWKSVLYANGVTHKATTRRHYRALNDAMRLNEYEVAFTHFPSLPGLRPFGNWPDGSLNWYDAYNLVKHGREQHFFEATVLNAAEAVAACAIMITAEFGLQGLRFRRELREFFSVTRQPTWPLRNVYLMPHGAELRAIPFPFDFKT